MSVLSYLSQRASSAVLSTIESAAIATSIETVQKRLNAHFPFDLAAHFRFGSSTRGTILPRKMDQRSDIDYLVVFRDGAYKPQTYLDRLRRFVEARYTRSEIYQSSPTIVLELGHIMFELVPALNATYGGYLIPNGPQDWQNTDPTEFNAKLERVNVQHGHLIKPTIRLAKFWNAQNSFIYGSYLLERWIADLPFWGCTNQRDYLFHVIDQFSIGGLSTQWAQERVQRAKKIVEEVRQLEAAYYPVQAEEAVKRLIPA